MASPPSTRYPGRGHLQIDASYAGDVSKRTMGAELRGRAVIHSVQPKSRPHEARPPRAPRTARPPRPAVRRIGYEESSLRDMYHTLMVSSWWRFFGFIAIGYFSANALFASAYVVAPGCLENAREGSFSDAFFFSVQTMATIGYGKMTPVTPYANGLVTVESLLGIFGVALVTGLTFAKFSRPTARVMFSDVAVVCPRDGVQSLMIRMANQRVNRIVDVQLHAILAINDTTVEGENVRRFLTLKLTRDRVATFVMTFTAVHPITEESPLFGLSPEELAARSGEVMISLLGMDETFAQTIHARGVYMQSDIVYGERFVDIVVLMPDGGRTVDYTKFHETQPIA
jgi:inward rectifier potassium channel